MKNLIINFIIIFVVNEQAFGQSSTRFDSVIVYTSQYYGTGPHLNQYDIIYNGDSVLIADNKIVEHFFNKLKAMKKRSSSLHLKKIRNDFTSENINVRAVFVFYKKTEKTVIGISPQPLMFMNNKVFEKKNIKLEKIVKPSLQLYKNLFPTREEILNRN